MIGTQLERLLKVADRFGWAPVPRGQQAEVVPGICRNSQRNDFGFGGRILDADADDVREDSAPPKGDG